MKVKGGLLRKARRFWDYGGTLRERFGVVNGSRLSLALAEVEYRRPRGELVTLRIPSWKEPIVLRAGMSDSAVFRQVLVHRELEFDLDPPPVRILDGGANIGLASRMFSHRWPKAEIVGVELELGNATAALRNCASTAGIQIVHAALWDRSGEVALEDPGADSWTYRVREDGLHGMVRAYRISELLDELGWDTVDLVKLDIEGAERRVLADSSSWLPRVRHLLVELHDRLEPGCTEAFEAAIAGHGWTVRRQGEYMLASRVPQ